MECRAGCAACCIAPSITTPIPGMPAGKAAGVPCIQLNENGLCLLFGEENRPRVCQEFRADINHCGSDSKEALVILSTLERLTT